jgi:ribosomal protein S18 acetylase RimI-like enzyme
MYNCCNVVVNNPSRWMIKCWYYSPYPFPPTESFVDTLWVCPLCLLYYTHENDYSSHCACCSFATPGSIVYKTSSVNSLVFNGGKDQTEQYQLSIHCLDGKNDKLYAQNLCLLGKLFIDHKTIMYDLEPFLLYVLFRTRSSDNHSELIGFFSKERVSPEFHTLSCILIFPQHQQKGYGRLLMEFSYEIYKKQGTSSDCLFIFTARIYWRP